MKRFGPIVTIVLMFTLFVAMVSAQEFCTKANPCQEILVRNFGTKLEAPAGYKFVSKTPADLCVFGTEEGGKPGFFKLRIDDKVKDAETCLSGGRSQGLWAPFYSKKDNRTAGILIGELLGNEWFYFLHFQEDGPIGAFALPEIVENTTIKTVVKRISEIPYSFPVTELQLRSQVTKIEDTDTVIIADGYIQPIWVNGCIWKASIYHKPSCSSKSNTVSITLLKKSGDVLADGVAVRQFAEGLYGLYFRITTEEKVEVTEEKEGGKTLDEAAKELEKPVSSATPTVSTSPATCEPKTVEKEVVREVPAKVSGLRSLAVSEIIRKYSVDRILSATSQNGEIEIAGGLFVFSVGDKMIVASRGNRDCLKDDKECLEFESQLDNLTPVYEIWRSELRSTALYGKVLVMGMAWKGAVRACYNDLKIVEDAFGNRVQTEEPHNECGYIGKMEICDANNSECRNVSITVEVGDKETKTKSKTFAPPCGKAMIELSGRFSNLATTVSDYFADFCDRRK